MIGVISEDENQNKIFKPMAGATLGQGVPLGTWCSFEKDVAPSSNWLVAGSSFNANTYPALALYLGTNQVPYRYDHSRLGDIEDITISTNSASPTVMQYDGVVYITGGAPNESYASIIAYVKPNGEQNYTALYGARNIGVGSVTFDTMVIQLNKNDSIYIQNNVNVQGTYVRYYTHPLFIKATSIASDTDQQAILAQIQAYNTYSTEETLTGKTWIDGKPIYRKCYGGLSISFSTSEGWRTLGVTAPDNIETIVKGVILGADATTPYSLHDIPFNPALVAIGSNNTLFRYNQANSGVIHSVVIEYTKTTD